MKTQKNKKKWKKPGLNILSKERTYGGTQPGTEDQLLGYTSK